MFPGIEHTEACGRTPQTGASIVSHNFFVKMQDFSLLGADFSIGAVGLTVIEFPRKREGVMGQPSNSVREQVRQFVLEYSRPRGFSEIADDESLFKGNIVDSLGVFRMIAFLEETFPLTIEDTDIVVENFETIVQIDTFVKRKLGLAEAPAAPGQPSALATV